MFPPTHTHTSNKNTYWYYLLVSAARVVVSSTDCTDLVAYQGAPAPRSHAQVAAASHVTHVTHPSWRLLSRCCFPLASRLARTARRHLQAWHRRGSPGTTPQYLPHPPPDRHLPHAHSLFCRIASTLPCTHLHATRRRPPSLATPPRTRAVTFRKPAHTARPDHLALLPPRHTPHSSTRQDTPPHRT